MHRPILPSCARRAAALVLAGAAAAAAAAPAPAADDRATNFARTWRNVPFTTLQKTPLGMARVQARMDLRAHFFVLVGEPVIYCTGRWSLVSVGWLNAWGSGNVGRSYALTEKNTPAAAWRAVELTSANIAFPVRQQPGQRLSMACDPGVFFANGSERASFNVPGSPSWDRMLMRSAGEDWDKPSNYVGAADFKQKLRDGALSFWESDGYGTSGTWDLVPLKIDYDLGPLVEHVRALDAEVQAQAERERSAARDGQDPLDKMFAGVETRQARQRTERVQAESRSDADRAAAARRTLAERARVLRCQAQAAPPTASLEQASDQAVKEWQACRDTQLTAFEDKTQRPARWGYKGPDGGVRIEPRFAAARDFSEGLGLVRDEASKRWGYVGADGRFALEPRWEGAAPFSAGLAAVRVGDQWGYIDRSGALAIPARYDYARSFAGGVAAVQVKDRGWGFVDRSGREVVAPQFSAVTDMKDGRSSVEGRVLSIEGGCRDRRKTLQVGVLAAGGEWIEPLHEVTRGVPQLCLTTSPN